ncbi:hypothetical protein NDU88_003130 [Pleurodeles waltl]|uniref:Uncharacterized protein n=1 Tax=Pleurodeles waltl TaxID=8319 RepID=A0AAV7TQ48_PLEWA|nr:hypothetical protein NDU88_003130 [Pleurodeles waltl]
MASPRKRRGKEEPRRLQVKKRLGRAPQDLTEVCTSHKMRGENRSPISGSRPRCSGKDNLRLKKRSVVGPRARKSDRGSRRNPIRPRNREVRRNSNDIN